MNLFLFCGHCTLYRNWPILDYFRGGGRRSLSSGVQRSTEVMPAINPRLTKQSSKESNDGSVSSEGSKWVDQYPSRDSTEYKNFASAFAVVYKYF